ncbi:hypothetical protein B0H14DRAFT_3720254 [Mycena olivaceomarginata]|nr:hypothetical protein B0H14DRAFT_3720254 [Mycena olivaceomarginata]
MSTPSARDYRDSTHDEEIATDLNVDLSTIELRAEDLYDKEKVDLETLVIDNVFKLLQCDDKGLSPEEVERRIGLFGHNKLEQEDQNPFLQFLSFMWNPLSWVMEAAALVAIAFSNGEGRAPDWEGLERGAGNAVKALMDSLAPKAKIDSAGLVPGDMISFKIGDIVPADCRLTDAVTSLPKSKKSGDFCFSGSICKQGEAEGVVISTGANTFFGRTTSLVGSADDSTGHLQMILAQIGSFCLVVIGIFVLAEILVLYAGFRYSYRRGLDNILVLLIGGIPIAMPTVLSVTLAVGAQQLAKHKAIVTSITAIEELAGVTILCSDKTGTLTTNKITIDRETIHAIDASIVRTLGDASRARAGITLLDFQPFDSNRKRTEVTYRDEATGRLRRVTKGMTAKIIELCSRNRAEDLEDPVRVGCQGEVNGDDFAAPGNGFELIGLLSIFDPPREDTKQDHRGCAGTRVKVKMVTGDQLAIAKETGRRLGCSEDGPAADSPYRDLDHLIMEADGFAGVLPEHKYDIVKRLQGLGHLCAMTGMGMAPMMRPALSRANVGIAVEGSTDAARGAADIVLTEPGLSTIVHAIRGSRIIFQRMRNYAISARAVTIRIVVCFAISRCVQVRLPAVHDPDHCPPQRRDDHDPLRGPRPCQATHPIVGIWREIFSYAVAVSFVIIILETTFFQDKFGPNDYQLHMVVYLQVAIISQALIFRPSTALLGAFCIAQLISSIIAAYANWGFTKIHGISGGWIGIVWVWNILWFIPLDWIKFAMKATVIKSLRERRLAQQAKVPPSAGGNYARSSLYANRVSFIRRAARKVGFGQKVSVRPEELQRFGSIQAHRVGCNAREEPEPYR